MKVREALSIQKPEYYSRLQVVESKAKQLLEYSQGGAHLTFTPHGLSHISAVEDNYDWLLSDQDITGFNPMELFCLLSATFFHDALMIPPQLGGEASARKEHATLARDFLMKNRDAVGLSLHEANAIAEIIKGHALTDFDELRDEIVIGSSLVEIKKLAACLSLSDICHADASRAPEIVLHLLELDEESTYHWRRHLQISGITRKSERLLMSAITFSDQGSSAVEEYVTAIRRQLAVVRPYFDSMLYRITGVDLQEQRLKSQLDVTLRFQANTRAILDILIEGVYQRQDVFLRELVQNSLDACHLRLAKYMRRGEIFGSRIVISLLHDKNNLRAVRVDDNGIGMDVGDIQDTVLWIGNSVSKRTDVKKLLTDTTGKNLIATFGIGLLSCFKVSRAVDLNSSKEGRNPVRVKMSSITDEIKPTESNDRSTGSTFIIELREDSALELDMDQAIEYYFRMVQQASIEVLHLDWGAVSAGYTRDDIFKIATTEAEIKKSIIPNTPESCLVFHQLKGDDFLAWFWIISGSEGLPLEEGTIDILNEGVFVSEDPAGDWLPECMAFVRGVINFSAGAVDLPVSRDKVVSNKKLQIKQAIIADKMIYLIDRLVETTNSGSVTKAKLGTADMAALTLTKCLMGADDSLRERIVRRLDNYHIAYFQKDAHERDAALGAIRDGNPGQVYIHYSQGRWVNELCIFDGRTLYDKADDLTSLQAALLRQNGEVVLAAVRADRNDERCLEAYLLKQYFKTHAVRVVDLTEKKDAVSGILKPKSLPRSIKAAIGKNVKFIDVDGLPGKRSWRVGEEVWINVANADMRLIYRLLQRTDLSSRRMDLVNALLELVAHRFEDALESLVLLVLDEGDELPEYRVPARF